MYNIMTPSTQLTVIFFCTPTMKCSKTEAGLSVVTQFFSNAAWVQQSSLHNRSRNDLLISDHLIIQNRDACYVAFDLLGCRFSHPVLAHSISFRDSDAEDYHRAYFGSGLLTRRSPKLNGRCGFGPCKAATDATDASDRCESEIPLPVGV